MQSNRTAARHAWAPCMLAALAFVPPHSSAQTVFKCTDANGVKTYSQSPCGGDATELTVRAQRPASETSSANFDAIAKSNEEAAIGHSENACIAAAEVRVFQPSRSRLEDINLKIKQLYAAMSGANNNTAGAIYMNGLREQISALEASATAERTSADSLFATERQRCIEDRRLKEQRFREKHEPRAE